MKIRFRCEIPVYKKLSFTDSGSNKKRMKRKLKNFKRAYANGNITQEAVKRSLVSYSGHLSHGHTYHLRKRLLSNLVLRRKK